MNASDEKLPHINSSSPQRTRYDGNTVVLHWLTALLIAALWLMAQSEDILPRDWRHAMWSTHVALGASLVLIMGARILWRITRGRHLPSVNVGLLKAMEKAVHWALYGMIGVVLVLGIVNVAARGWDLFGLVQIPAFAADDRALRRSINGWHGLAANSLIVLAAFHAFAALLHQFIWKDETLQRMGLPRSGR